MKGTFSIPAWYLYIFDALSLKLESDLDLSLFSTNVALNLSQAQS